MTAARVESAAAAAIRGPARIVAEGSPESLAEGEPYSGSGTSPLALTVTACCACGDAPSEPVAIIDDFDFRTSPDTFLSLRCAECGSMYVSPAPAETGSQRLYPPSYYATSSAGALRGLRVWARNRREARRLAQWCRGLDQGARILDVGCGGGLHLSLLRGLGGHRWRLEGVDPNETAVQIARTAGLEVHRDKVERLYRPGQYDLVLLIRTLEHAFDPAAVLAAVRSALRPGGHAVVVVNNLASPSFALFAGRHWGGYDAPRQRRLFTTDGLSRLARRSGLELASLSTLASGDAWTRSVHRMLRDWGAPGWLVDRFGGKSILAVAGFGILDAMLRLRGRGALAVAILRRPSGESIQ
jgi:SAM-dependent methyltransferase